jgi:hypothetical protein
VIVYANMTVVFFYPAVSDSVAVFSFKVISENNSCLGRADTAKGKAECGDQVPSSGSGHFKTLSLRHQLGVGWRLDFVAASPLDNPGQSVDSSIHPCH